MDTEEKTLSKEQITSKLTEMQKNRMEAISTIVDMTDKQKEYQEIKIRIDGAILALQELLKNLE